jgi:probable selenium-dependent hydroxylase accessory protein YqeC
MKMRQGLINGLALKPREHIALVGGGGKTTLMKALATEIVSEGRRVVVTTTTKIRNLEALLFPTVIISEIGPGWMTPLEEALEAEGRAFVGERRGALGKIIGISPAAADRLYRDAPAAYLLVEADGSAGRPVKVPAGHEPVIPESATLVVAVMGLEALGRRFDPDTVFRGNEFAALTGLRPGGRLTPPVLAAVFQQAGGLFKGAPGSARRVVFLNKLDLLTDPRPAAELVHILTRPAGGIQLVMAGSLQSRTYPFVEVIT